MTAAAAAAAAPEREHAVLSASGSHKWLRCPRSARLEDAMPDRQTEHTLAGSLAHSIAELKLRKLYTEPMGTRKFNSALKKLKADEHYQDEMLRHTDTYVEYVQGLVHRFPSPPCVAVEKRVEYTAYAPEGFGRADCIVIGGRALHVIDFKYGQGVPVSAEDNPQMKLYALGALGAYWMLYEIDTVRMTIVQPRLNSISEYEMPAVDLREWGESIKPAAQQAWAGEGEFCPGEWCRNAFCKARPTCRAYNEHYLSLEAFGGKLPPLLTNDEVGGILGRARQLRAWVTRLEEYALSELLKGETIPGWKAVAGRSVRQFTDMEAAFAAVKEAGYDEALLYERKPITLTGVETLLGKAKFNKLLSGHVDKPRGKPALAPETDNREAITNRTTAADDFAETINTEG